MKSVITQPARFVYTEAPNSRRISTAEVTTRLGKTRLYTFNDDFQVTEIQDELGNTTQYPYTEDGKVSSVTDGNGNTTHYEYSANGKISRVSGDASITPFLFNGMYGVMTDDNGLYMRARYYSPEMIAAATVSELTEEQIAAGMISRGQLGRRIYGSAVIVGKKFQAFIEINLEGCYVVNPMPFIYLVPNTEPLNLNGRNIRYGEVILP